MDEKRQGQFATFEEAKAKSDEIKSKTGDEYKPVYDDKTGYWGIPKAEKPTKEPRETVHEMEVTEKRDKATRAAKQAVAAGAQVAVIDADNGEYVRPGEKGWSDYFTAKMNVSKADESGTKETVEITSEPELEEIQKHGYKVGTPKNYIVERPKIVFQPKAGVKLMGKEDASAPQLSAEDQAAVDWAKANSKDPRAAQILSMHGIK